MLVISTNIKELNTRTKVLHQLTERPRWESPMVRCIVSVEFCVDWNCGLKREAMSGSQAVPEDDADDESTL